MKKSLFVFLTFLTLAAVLISSLSLFQKAKASSTLNVTISGGYFRGIPSEITYKTFKNSFSNSENWNWNIYPANAAGKYDYFTESSSAYIGTGCTFRIEYGFSNIQSYDIVVLGDVNGDGMINSADYIALKAHVKKIDGAALNGSYLKAADLNDDSRVTATDYLRLKRYLAGLYDINRTYVSDPVPTNTSPTNGEGPWYSGWY